MKPAPTIQMWAAVYTTSRKTRWINHSLIRLTRKEVRDALFERAKANPVAHYNIEAQIKAGEIQIVIVYVSAATP